MSNRLNTAWLQQVKAASDEKALREIREMQEHRLSAELPSVHETTVPDAVNELQESLIVRAVQLAEMELALHGHGSPPAPYAFVLFGSGGRGEQTFSSDQDSGILYANPPSNEASEACRLYFPILAEAAVTKLTRLGYPPCDGNVVASNPEWCLPLAEWESKIEAWFADPSWEHVRYLLIVADGRPVSGDLKLAFMLKNRFFTEMLFTPGIARRMIDNTLRYKALIGVFGQLLPERYGEQAGSLDVKYGAYLPLVNVIRFLAVQAGIRETSTIGRIQALRQMAVLSAADAERACSALRLLLTLRLRTGKQLEDGRKIGSGHVPKDQLSKEETAALRQALKFVRQLQRRVERHTQRGGSGR